MNKKDIKTGTTNILKPTHHLLKPMTLVISMCLAACANIQTKEEYIHAILEKENVLIEKLKTERAQPEVNEAVSKNENLKNAETHLSLALEELKGANDAIKSTIIKEKQREIHYGRN